MMNGNVIASERPGHTILEGLLVFHHTVDLLQGVCSSESFGRRCCALCF